MSSPTRSSEERAISLLAVLAAVALSLGIAAQPRRGSADLHTPDMQTRITAMAEAIAVAEGFYAPGRHNGHSLPHALNNPGALKKPTLNAAGLATWKDTGLVVFPDAQAGWAALRHQIALMLSGKSGIYTPSDNLLEVARKYAEGDLNWGRNVAGELGVPPHTTLAELGPGASRLEMVILPRLRAGLMARLGEGARQFRTWIMRPNRATTEVACSVP